MRKKWISPSHTTHTHTLTKLEYSQAIKWRSGLSVHEPIVARLRDAATGSHHALQQQLKVGHNTVGKGSDSHPEQMFLPGCASKGKRPGTQEQEFRHQQQSP